MAFGIPWGFFRAFLLLILSFGCVSGGYRTAVSLNGDAYIGLSDGLNYDGSTGLWEPFTVSGRKGAAWVSAVATKEYLMFTGGTLDSFNSVCTDRVEFFFPSNISENSVTGKIEPRCDMAGTTVNHLALFAGGYHGSLYSNSLDIYDTNTNTWNRSTISIGRHAMGCTSLQNLAFFAGGQANQTFFSNVDIFNSTTGHIQNRSLTIARGRLAATSTSRYAFFAGGTDGIQEFDVVDIYNIESNSWDTHHISLGRSNLVATSLGEIAFFAGGISQQKGVSTLDWFNGYTSSWNSTNQLIPQSSRYLIATTANNLAIIGNSFSDFVGLQRAGVCPQNSFLNQNYSDFIVCRFSSDENSITKTQTIVMSVFGGLLGIVLVIFAVYLFLRYKKEKRGFLREKRALKKKMAAAKKRTDTPDTTNVEDLASPHLSNIEVLHKLGEGHFGQVFYGKWGRTSVALKKLEESEFKAFEKEAQIMSSLIHPNIVQFLGLYTTNGTRYIVTEYAENGSLQDYLKHNQGKLTIGDKVKFLVDAAKGMEYLASQKVIHRDLACRNLLVNKGLEVLVNDFGLSRFGDEYHLSEQSKVPIKWTAIEVLMSKPATVASDVWSFGIVCWEVLEDGDMPYPDYATTVLLSVLKEGKRLPRPKECLDVLWSLMERCWKEDPTERPNFQEIVDELEVLSQSQRSYLADSWKSAHENNLIDPYKISAPAVEANKAYTCLLYTSPSPRDA
eukprot:TRINITY_DN2959_c0_g1_i4.p1 TRINITY_DN2959_c0_g1~~TRINITY_DN2959_c0_g1_i4.p1  ORF type:complete len:728 (-),score=108.04 TRINITY_DN2959_c0_g1_i4:19-2202(-)